MATASTRRTFLASAAASPLVYVGLRSADPLLTDQSGQPLPAGQKPLSPREFLRAAHSWSREELEAVLEVVRQDDWAPPDDRFTAPCRRADWWSALFILSWGTVSSLSRCLRLRHQDVDLARGILTIPPEASKLGGIVRQAFPLSAIAALTMLPGSGDDPLFPWAGDRFSFHRQLRRILSRAFPRPAPSKVVSHTGMARVAILAGVYEFWAPRNWRSVPSTGTVRDVSEPLSFCEARKQAKAFNLARAEHPAMWAIVVATDGRKAVQA
jgi:hypothetical protein